MNYNDTTKRLLKFTAYNYAYNEAYKLFNSKYAFGSFDTDR